jgi:hypothetical protein
MLITPNEVVELAFSPHDQIDPALLTDTRIEAAQLKFLRPALKNLYTALTEGAYDDFCRKFIKPALAYFVKYHIFLCLSVRIGSDGIIRQRMPDAVPADLSQIARLRHESRETAYLLLEKAFNHLKNNAVEFPEFDPWEHCRRRRPRIHSGIVM